MSILGLNFELCSFFVSETHYFIETVPLTASSRDAHCR
jgi:hypothetical protein